MSYRRVGTGKWYDPNIEVDSRNIYYNPGCVWPGISFTLSRKEGNLFLYLAIGTSPRYNWRWSYSRLIGSKK